MDKHTATTRLIFSGGFTLLELMVCAAVLLIVALAAGPVLVGAQGNWESAYDSVTSGLTKEGRAARIVLQRVVRRASLQNVTVGSDAHWIDLPYYDSPDSTRVDRYARVSWSDGGLRLREGLIDEHGQRQMLTEVVICDSLSDCVFTRSGSALRMTLTFAAGTTQMTMVAAALTNNK
jgi:prepilin-type N-terminal cleavage/methylation domain-containing protein